MILRYFQSGQTPIVIFITYNLPIFFQNIFIVFENFKKKIGIITLGCDIIKIKKIKYL